MVLSAEEATRRFAEKEFRQEIIYARIEIEHHEGFKCCTGDPLDDPNCMHSFEEDDSDTYTLVGFTKDGTLVYKPIGDGWTSFNDVLSMILVVGLKEKEET